MKLSEKFSNFWWKLPSWITNNIQPQWKNNIEITVQKRDNKWTFSQWNLLTFFETLVNSDELSVLAGGEDRVKLLVTTYPQDNQHLEYTFLDDCPEIEDASLYVSHFSGEIIWLCGWLRWYFRCSPSKLYVSVI